VRDTTDREKKKLNWIFLFLCYATPAAAAAAIVGTKLFLSRIWTLLGKVKRMGEKNFLDTISHKLIKTQNDIFTLESQFYFSAHLFEKLNNAGFELKAFVYL
jgi:hypothetical protein